MPNLKKVLVIPSNTKTLNKINYFVFCSLILYCSCKKKKKTKNKEQKSKIKKKKIFKKMNIAHLKKHEKQYIH